MTNKSTGITSAAQQLAGTIVSPAKLVRFDLTPASKVVVDAVRTQDVASAKWLKAADALYAAGVRAPMLLEKGALANLEVIAQVKAIIVSAWSEKVQKMINCSKSELMDMDQDDRAVRRVWTNKVPVMLAHLRTHLKTHEVDATGGNGTITLADTLVSILNERIRVLQGAKPEKLECFADVTKTIGLIRAVITSI